MSLLIYLPLNGNLTNYGNGSIGAISGTPQWINDSPSGLEKSLNLSSKIIFAQANSSVAGLKQFTICFWVKITNETNNTNLNWQDIIGFNTDGGSYDGGQFRWETGYNSKGIHWHNNTDEAIVTSAYNHTSVNDGIWYHIAFVRKLNVTRSFTNGEFKTQINTNSSYPNGRLRGNFWLGETDHTFGAISDVRIYDEALSDTKIAKIAQLRKNKNKGCLVWIPAINDWHNQGLDTVNFTVTNSNTVNPGKIGITAMKGYTNSFLVPSLVGAKQYSYAMWVKIDTATSTNWLNSITFIMQNYSTELYSRQEFYNNSTTTNFWHDGTPNACTATTQVVGEWHHWAGTMDLETGEAHFYKDGIAVTDRGLSPSSGSLTGYISIGENGLDTIVNDVRIYNICLTPNEIKRLAQGNTCHWQLNNNGIKNYNLLKNGNFYTGERSPWNKWGYVDNFYGITIKNNKHWYHYQTGIDYGGFSQAAGVTILPNTKYTVSATVYASAPCTGCFWFHWRSTPGGANLSQNTQSFDISTTPQRFSKTFTSYSDSSVQYFHLMIGNLKGAGVAGIDVYYTDLKMEIGEIATPYSPYIEELTNLNKIYDGSGYSNNTILSVFTNANNQPKYINAVLLNKSKLSCNSGFPSGTNPDFTICFWAKILSSQTYTIYQDLVAMIDQVANNEGNPCRLEICGSPVGNNFMWFRGFTGQSSGGMNMNNSSNDGWWSKDNWHFVALTGSSTKTYKCYFDGIETQSYTNSSNTWAPTGKFAINDTIGGAIEYSDVRVFATTLTADEIMNLYKMGHVA